MLKRFRDFRDKLRYKQLEKIFWGVGIIIAIAYVAIIILTEPWKYYTMEDDIPFPMEAFVVWFLLEISILGLIWLFLDGPGKAVIHESEECKSRLKEKLKENEEAEVLFMPSGISGGVKKILKKPYEILGLTYLVHKEDDKIIVRLMQGEKELTKETIENGCFFESNFKFPETEEKE